MAFDLHTHSTCSDGVLKPSQVVALAARAGLAGLALTDHDTTAGWDEAAQTADDEGIAFVGGLELSTEVAGRSLHLLGYFVDPAFPALVEECARLRGERLRRAAGIVARLGDLGVRVDLDDVVARAAGAPVGRPHIAAAMVAAGVVPDAATAFDDYLRDGGQAVVPKHALHPVDAIGLIRAAGGVAVLAHPGLGERGTRVSEPLLGRLVDAGLAGIEADHAGHDEPTRQAWRAASARSGLEVTGSSDFHGSRGDSGVGAATTPPAVLDRLRERAPVPVSPLSDSAAAPRKAPPW